MRKLKPYPTWVCIKCGTEAVIQSDRYHPTANLSTFHKGICDVCGKRTSVTESRDYGYPKFEGHEHVDK